MVLEGKKSNISAVVVNILLSEGNAHSRPIHTIGHTLRNSYSVGLEKGDRGTRMGRICICKDAARRNPRPLLLLCAATASVTWLGDSQLTKLRCIKVSAIAIGAHDPSPYFRAL